MLQANLHAIHFKRILDFGEGQGIERTPHKANALPHKGI